MIQKRHKVAILNYPLMDNRLNVHDYYEYLKLDQQNTSQWVVPMYIHIPFCFRICKFCVYSRIVPGSESIVQQYTDALVKEIKLYGQSPYVRSMKIGAIFFGGGTPTCLSIKQIAKIISACREYLPLTSDVEISFECNTYNADEEKIHYLRELNVSRISAGIQTFNPRYRSLLGLKATCEEVNDWLSMVKKYGFKDLAIDLMYGLPGQSCEEWKEDISLALNHCVSHLSIYELYIMAGSKLYDEMSANKTAKWIEQEKLYEMYTITDKILKNAGLEHQIIPEYNKPGNSAAYWKLVYDGYGDNLSVGASSFGYINGITYQNYDDIDTYIKNLKDNKLPILMVSNKANLEQLMERTVVLALRRGYIENDMFNRVYGIDLKSRFGHIIDELIEQNLIIQVGGIFKLTTLGEYLQGDISVKFMESTFKNSTNLKRNMCIGKHIIPDAI